MEKIKSYKFKKLIGKIKTNKFMLPAWQREFVWDLKKIEFLFDSIFKQYPISNILLWETGSTNNDIFYSFISSCEFVGKKPNAENDSDRSLVNSIDAVLDGQQRLTSIYLVLDNNTHIYKESSSRNHQELRLYINLTNKESIQCKFYDKDQYNVLMQKGWFDLKEIYNSNKYIKIALKNLQPNNKICRIIERNYGIIKKS